MSDWTVTVRGWTLEIPAGTETDGASIPRMLWRLCGHPLQVPRVYAALVHDWLYSANGPAEIDRAEADAVYRDLLILYGWGAWRAWTEYLALRACGASHWEKKEKENTK